MFGWSLIFLFQIIKVGYSDMAFVPITGVAEAGKPLKPRGLGACLNDTVRSHLKQFFF